MYYFSALIAAICVECLSQEMIRTETFWREEADAPLLNLDAGWLAKAYGPEARCVRSMVFIDRQHTGCFCRLLFVFVFFGFGLRVFPRFYARFYEMD
jgi:hypothetical protein